MKKVTLFISLVLFASIAKSQTVDCYKFKEGKFRIADTRAGAVTIAERRGGYQIESSEALKVIIRLRITWQDDCTYTLRLDKVIRNENKIAFPADLEVHAKIIATTAKGYTQQISSSLTSGTYNVEVEKID